MINQIKTYFKFDNRKATFKKELIGGLVTFLSMAYILAIQPAMLSTFNPNTGEPIMPQGGVFLSTVISSFVATFAMGLFANVPIGLAPGMGINAFFVYTVCILMGLPTGEALSIVMISGWLYFIVVISPLREIVRKAFPKNIKLAIGAAIGFFIAFLGLQESGIIQTDAALAKQGVDYIASSVTSVKFGNLKNPLILLGILVMFMMFVLHYLRIKGSIIIAMGIGLIVMAIMYAFGVKEVTGANSPFKLNNFSSQFKGLGDIAGRSYLSVGSALANPISYVAIFVFVYTDFFDTTGTLFAIDETANLSKNDPERKWMKKANVIDAFGTVFGASIGSTTVTTFVESSTGISSGAKTGFASLITGSMFMLAIFIWPIMNPLMPIKMGAQVVTPYQTIHPLHVSPITSPAMILVGSLMMMQLKEFEWKKIVDVPTLFITIMFMVLSYSISNGIAAGIIMFVVMNFFAGIRQRIEWKKGRQFTISEEGEIPSADLDVIKKAEPIKDYWKRISISMIVLFVLSMIYFGTMVLYSY